MLAFGIALVVAVALAALGSWARTRYAGSGGGGRVRRSDGRRWPPFRQCPVCRTPLEKGQSVRTARFPAREGVATVHLAGCPHCLPPAGGGPGVARGCPVCKRQLADADYLLGRMWQQGEVGRTRVPGDPAPLHIRISGCNHCIAG